MFRVCAAAAAIAALMALASPASAQQFTTTPTAEDFAREYPPTAREAGLSGNAEIRCRANRDGELTRCRVESETPAGAGFGEAGLRMMQYFRVPPPEPEMGRTASSPSVTIPLSFTITPGGVVPPTAPAQPQPPN